MASYPGHAWPGYEARRIDILFNIVYLQYIHQCFSASVHQCTGASVLQCIISA